MPAVSRRAFIHHTATGAAAAWTAIAERAILRASPNGWPIGCQTFPYGKAIEQKPIGKGSIDWVKTFRAAKTGGVQNYFIEMKNS